MTEASSFELRIPDFPIVPSDGHWEWREDQGGLKYISTLPDKTGASKKKNNSNDFSNKNELFELIRRQTGVTLPARGAAAAAAAAANQQPRGLKKENTVPIDERITLEHVKQVTLNSGEVRSGAAFGTFIESQVFDNFAASLLVYFNDFFKILEIDNQPRGMVAELSAVEKKNRLDACLALTSSERTLGFHYSILILGIGLPDKHHMGCGSNRVSATHKDRTQFEKFYSYCSLLVWICFHRKHNIETIRKEIGRILKSNYFNPFSRQVLPDHVTFLARAKSNQSQTGQGAETNLVKLKQKEAANRPPIMSIVRQKSPALISLLPSTKEQALWLFDRLDDDVVKQNGEDQSETEHKPPPKTNTTLPENLKVGIIGDSMHKFNPKTLKVIEKEKRSAGTAEGQTLEGETLDALALVTTVDDLTLPDNANSIVNE